MKDILVTLINSNEKKETTKSLSELNPKMKYKLHIRLDNERFIDYLNKLNIERIYEELEILESLGIISLDSDSFKQVIYLKNKR